MSDAMLHGVLFLQHIVTHLGGVEAVRTDKDIWYHSPFHPHEETPSFKINMDQNKWYDYRTNQTGGVHALWITFQGYDIRQESAWKMADNVLRQKALQEMPQPLKATQDNQSIVQETMLLEPPQPIYNLALIEALTARRLRVSLVQAWVKQAPIQDIKSGQHHIALVFENDQKGYTCSVWNKNRQDDQLFFVGQKAPTTLSTQSHVGYAYQRSNEIFIFATWWDYVAWLQINNQEKLDATVFILNDLETVDQVIDNIKAMPIKPSSVMLALGNDPESQKTLFKVADDLGAAGIYIVGAMNEHYKPYKDILDCLIT
jgi:hypothetical protein